MIYKSKYEKINYVLYLFIGAIYLNVKRVK